MYVIAIREARDTDNPQISEVVRKAYSSNVSSSWLSALFNEVTFQCIVLLAAFMFIFIGVPLQYCLASVPMVLVLMYLLIYAAVLVKAAELMHSKRPLKCWVAEAYEPYFLGESPRNCLYRVVGQEQVVDEGINVDNYRKVIIGTCAVMNHNLTDEWAWLFRLAVNEKYRKKGVGLGLIQAAKKWCKDSRFDSIELVITECQEDARQLFTNAGFQVKQLYHKRLFTSAFSIQMFQMRCEIRPTFK